MIALTALLFSACSSGRMSTRRASERLKPAESLPERERSQSPHNLVIRIGNVADSGPSYKNFVTLTINGKEIAPERAEHNLKSDYVYKFHLAPGAYDVKAKYHVVGFWRKRVYQIRTDERVRILPNSRTELSIDLEKDRGGFPRNKKNFFAIRQFDFGESAVVSEAPRPTRKIEKLERQEAPREKLRAPKRQLKEEQPLERTDQQTVTPEPPAVQVTPPAPPVQQPGLSPGRIKLQINSIPVGADIYVNDRFVGQSPARVIIDRSEGHIIQITKAGYKEYLKVIDAGELVNKNDLQVIVRLEKDN